MSEKRDITYSTLIKIKSGNNKNPTLEILTKLASVFKIRVDGLVGKKMDKTKNLSK